jgi:Domain of unknown function (DUF6815)
MTGSDIPRLRPARRASATRPWPVKVGNFPRLINAEMKVKALVDAPAERAAAGPRLYTSNADPRFQRLRRLMENDWTPQLSLLLDIPRRDLPMIWDADFMLGRPGADGNDSYVLGEINVSSVFPMPNEAPAEIARRVADRLRAQVHIEGP